MPWITLALLFGALTPVPQASQTDPALSARCEAARSIIAGQLEGREKPVIIVSSRGFGDSKISVTNFLQGWFRDGKPSQEFAARFLATPQVDLLEACLELPRALAGEGVAFGEAEVTAMIERSRNAQGRTSMFYTSDILAFSLPVVSADGQSALMHSSGVCGALCGSGSVTYLKRDAQGVWKGQNGRTSWIS